jgi:hypothetical protein
MKKHHQNLISNENHKQDSSSDRINSSTSEIIIDQIDDELLRRLSQGKIKYKNKILEKHFFFLIKRFCLSG